MTGAFQLLTKPLIRRLVACYRPGLRVSGLFYEEFQNWSSRYLKKVVAAIVREEAEIPPDRPHLLRTTVDRLGWSLDPIGPSVPRAVFHDMLTELLQDLMPQISPLLIDRESEPLLMAIYQHRIATMLTEIDAKGRKTVLPKDLTSLENSTDVFPGMTLASGKTGIIVKRHQPEDGLQLC